MPRRPNASATGAYRATGAFGPLSRRELLSRCGLGIGSLGLASILSDEGLLGSARADSVPVGPHFRPRAKRVIHIFAEGGASQFDTFDPKPLLAQHDGKPYQEVIKTHYAGRPDVEQLAKSVGGTLMGSPFKFAKHGQSGIEVSELLPNVAGIIDEFCVIRSMTSTTGVHEPAQVLLNTGHATLPRPSLGAWTIYGLGSENANLPAFVSLSPPHQAGPAGYSNAFLPAWTAGTPIAFPGEEGGKFDPEAVINHLRSGSTSLGEQRRQIELVERLHREFTARQGSDAQLDGRIGQYETAFRMQLEARDAFDLSREPQSVARRYGDTFVGRQCMLARRLVERGVRFVQVYQVGWDTHDDNDARHRGLCRKLDQPLTALIQDLKERDMLDDTLVIWAGEFGRTSTRDGSGTGGKAFGRAHNPGTSSILMAGGGIRGGMVYGKSDDFGHKAVENAIDVHDFHATILHLLGFDHTKLTYTHSGREFRLTDVHGRVLEELFA